MDEKNPRFKTGISFLFALPHEQQFPVFGQYPAVVINHQFQFVNMVPDGIKIFGFHFIAIGDGFVPVM